MTTTPTTQIYTFEHYLTLNLEQRTELVDGELNIMNPTTLEHFLIAKFFERTLALEIQRLQQPWLCFREAGVRTTLGASGKIKPPRFV